MTPKTKFERPPVWPDERLEVDRMAAIGDFIAERRASGNAPYRAAFAEAALTVVRLLANSRDLLDFAGGAALSADGALRRSARYLAAPVISEADLDTLAGANVSTRRLNPTLAARAAEVIGAFIDPERFPWLYETPPRIPGTEERQAAIRWTAGLMAAQDIQTGRRGESSRGQEAAVAALLSSVGFTQVPVRPISITGGLAPGEFSREAEVEGTKCDVPVGLRDGRLLLIECKVSNSGVNSVKRLNRETAGKASFWAGRFGERAITAACIAGVFRLTNLRAAQEDGVWIIWARDLEPLREFLARAVP